MLAGAAGARVPLTWQRGGRIESDSAGVASPELVRVLERSRSVLRRRQLVERSGRGRIGYVALDAIDAHALDELTRQLRFFLADREAIVLDLRENVGGDLPVEFLRALGAPKLLEKRPRDERPQAAPGPVWERPLAVLIGPGTGSAAEIVAAGLDEAGAALLIGEPTQGAVIGASEIGLLDGSEFRIPRVGWFTTNGDNLEGRGVHPDRVVTAEFEEEARNEDRALSAAIEALLDRLDR
jgi:C-terminal processing protease CtpA/Prc